MSDDLVKRLRMGGFTVEHLDAAADAIERLSKDLNNAVWADSEMCRELEAAIERLTRERDEAHQRYVDANEARIDAEQKVEKLREALKPITSGIYWDSAEIVKARAVLAETEN